MKRFRTVLVLAAVLLLVCCWTAMAEEERSSRFSAPDQPGEDDILNRELWQFAKGTPYEEAERHIKEVKEKRQEAPVEEIELPSGWKIAPAGQQVEVGRLPEEAVLYAGKIVVLNTGYYLKEKEPSQEISIVDPAFVDPDSGEKAPKVVKVLHPGSLFPCAVAGKDGYLYVSGGCDQKVYRYDDMFELKQKYPMNGYTAGLAPIDPEHLAVVYLVGVSGPESDKRGDYGKGKLAILNTATGVIEHEVEVGYFPHTVRYLKSGKKNGKLYVTVLGEDKLNVYDAHFLKLLKSLNVSLGIGKTPQDICPDPKANRLYVVNTGSDNLSVVDAEKDDVVSEIAVGSRGEGFGCGPTSCAVDPAHPDRLLVTLAYSNAVGIFDKKEYKPLGFIPTAWYPTKVIAVPGKDWVAVLSAKGIHARRPKGEGPLLARRPNVNGPQPTAGEGGPEYVLTLLKGTLGIIARDQIENNINKSWTQKQVNERSPIGGPSSEGINLPLNLRDKIHHVFFIVRENRTYDQVLGDLGKGEGDPYLTLFGKEITPNAHELANEFVTLDHYYANGEISVLGHSYTTSGYASPFLEWLGNMSYSERYEGYPFASVPALTSPVYLWDNLDKNKKIEYRIYGENYFLYTRAYRIVRENFPGSKQGQKFFSFEPDSKEAKKFYSHMMALADKGGDRGKELYNLFPHQPPTVHDVAQGLKNDDCASRISKLLLGDESLVPPLQKDDKLRRQFAELFYHYPTAYRSWDLMYSDLDRVQVWKSDFEEQIKQIKPGDDKQIFHYIWLPNDHTAGIDKKSLAPDQFVAQNDAALGIIINTISHSPIWKESLILVTEDDAQDGPDHVDATRTVGLAIGPYVKRGAVVSERYDQLSMLRTIEMLLGLDPLNQNDALAVPMFGIFIAPPENPDPKQYELSPPSDHLDGADLMRYNNLLEPETKKP